MRLFAFLLRRRDLDFVHFYSTKLILLGPIIAVVARKPSIVTITGFGRAYSDPSLRYRIARFLHALLLWLAVRLTNAVLCQNHHDVAMLQRRYKQHRDKIHYVGSATPMGLVQRELWRDDRPMRVVHLARLLKSKGIQEFVQVADALHGPKFQFILAGPASPSEPATEKTVHAAQDRGSLQYVGQIHSADVAELLRSADVFLFTSHAEGMPRAMLEAGAHALCPIAFDIPANRDLIREGGGYLLPLGDVGGIVRLLEYLVADPDRVRVVGEKYRTHISEEFSVDSFCSRLDSILLLTLKPSGPR